MTGRHRAAFVALLVIAAGIAVAGLAQFADGHLAPGVLGLASASLGVVSALLVRLNWQILAINRTLIDQNRVLLEQVRHSSSLPPH